MDLRLIFRLDAQHELDQRQESHNHFYRAEENGVM
jgi:hypothetical protein